MRIRCLLCICLLRDIIITLSPCLPRFGEWKLKKKSSNKKTHQKKIKNRNFWSAMWVPVASSVALSSLKTLLMLINSNTRGRPSLFLSLSLSPFLFPTFILSFPVDFCTKEMLWLPSMDLLLSLLGLFFGLDMNLKTLLCLLLMIISVFLLLFIYLFIIFSPFLSSFLLFLSHSPSPLPKKNCEKVGGNRGLTIC